jgi:RNA polymerase sigma factor (sigma-70 family)
MRGQLTSALAHLRCVVTRRCDGGLDDADLLHRFAAKRDEAAFEVLIWRHGPMVFGVANRVLHNADDSEDVLQATFLALVRQARSIGRGGAVASWLYRVAYRTALRVRARRQKLAPAGSDIEELPASASADERFRRDSLDALDEELQRLPEKYRTPLILSYLQGLTNQETASRLGCPIGTVFTRLARGRELLRKRLRRRGATATAGLLGGASGPSMAAQPLGNGLVQATIRAGRQIAGESAAAASVPSLAVFTLAEGVGQTMVRRSRSKLIGAALVLLAVAGAGTGLLALRGSPPEPPPATEIAASVAPAAALEHAASSAADAAPVKPDRPRVVAVFPADGAKDVEPVTEIRIRFDRPMNRSNVSISWIAPEGGGYRSCGDVRYVEATREFVFPVQLTSGVKHELVLNAWGLQDPGDQNYRGFRSEDKVAAQVYRWSFTTAKPAARPGTPPGVTFIQPFNDMEVALLTSFEIAFDRPMDPLAYGLDVPGLSIGEVRPQLLGPPSYDAKQHRFSLLVRLPPNWNGELHFRGFRGADGVPVGPIGVKCRTLRTILTPARLQSIEQAGRSAELRKIVEDTRNARRGLKSVTEEAVWTITSFSGPDWFQAMSSEGSRYQVQGRQKFLGVIDDAMQIPFRVGSDGDVCWLRSGDERVVVPAKDIAQKNVFIADVFNAFGSADTDRVIRDLKLEYLGETTVRGRRCHRVRSWAVGVDTDYVPNAPHDCFIDAETLLFLRIEAGTTGLFRFDYTHSRINAPIPDEEFRPDSDPGVHAGSDHLPEGYTSRYLNVNDGSTGRISVHWGMRGQKGSSQGGQN